MVTNVPNLGRTSRLIGLRKCFKFPTCLLLVLVLVLGDDELRRWLAEDVHIFPELVQLFLKAFTVGVCGSTISATRPVPVADYATRTRTRPAPKISTHTRPDPRVYPYP